MGNKTNNIEVKNIMTACHRRQEKSNFENKAKFKKERGIDCFHCILVIEILLH